MMIFNTMSVDGSNFQADMDALRLYYDALCEYSKDNSSFDSMIVHIYIHTNIFKVSSFIFGHHKS